MRPQFAALSMRTACAGRMRMLGHSGFLALSMPCASFFTPNPVRYCAPAFAATSQPPPAGGGRDGGSHDGSGSSADNASSALDIAMRVNKLKRLHQTGGSGDSNKKQIEFTAWKELNTLTEDQINHAEGKSVALLLNSWAYFAKFWEKGKDGPQGASSSDSKQQPGEHASVASKKS